MVVVAAAVVDVVMRFSVVGKFVDGLVQIEL